MTGSLSDTTTVILIDEGDRRCDERCHNATDPRCDCICNGRYHGVSLRIGGLTRALQEEQPVQLTLNGLLSQPTKNPDR